MSIAPEEITVHILKAETRSGGMAKAVERRLVEWSRTTPLHIELQNE
jgi:hypothetical protein